MKRWLTFTLILTLGLQSMAQVDSITVLDTTYVIDYKGFDWGQDGEVKGYYPLPGSPLAVHYHWKFGKIYGAYRAYYPNGGLIEFGVYADGMRHGEWTVYGEQEEVLIKGKYKNGVKDGYWAYRAEGWYGRYKNGHKKGRWKRIENGYVVEYQNYKAPKTSKSP